MTSYLSRLNPTPEFPEYTGPYKVGSIDVEIPVSELESPSPAPDESISTVQYRMFYPCQPESTKKEDVTWVPAPQRESISAYARFAGAGSKLAEFISYVLLLKHPHIVLTIEQLLSPNPSLRHDPRSQECYPSYTTNLKRKMASDDIFSRPWRFAECVFPHRRLNCITWNDSDRA